MRNGENVRIMIVWRGGGGYTRVIRLDEMSVFYEPHGISLGKCILKFCVEDMSSIFINRLLILVLSLQSKDMFPLRAVVCRKDTRIHRLDRGTFGGGFIICFPV